MFVFLLNFGPIYGHEYYSFAWNVFLLRCGQDCFADILLLLGEIIQGEKYTVVKISIEYFL